MKAIFTLAIVIFFSLFCTTASAQTVNLGGKVWWDFNDNGKQEVDEIPTQWIGVTLYFDNDDNGVSDAGTTPITISTDVNGEYMFTNLAPGKYYVRADVGYSHYKTTVYGGDPDNNIIGDNNGHSQNVGNFKIKSETIELQPGTEPDGTGATNTNTNKTLDFGTWKANGLGDLVWADNNSNGTQDAGEPGIANVTVILMNLTGATLATTTTDAQGKYHFYDPMGYYGTNDYQVAFVTPVGYLPTISNFGANDDNDSDPINGIISSINVPQGKWDHSFDAGFKPVSLLPLNLLSFTASLKADKVDLKWVTTNEVSVSYIVLEKSTDGKNYNDIATIFANNNGAEKNYYQYSDKINTKENANYYYRLRTVNNNGSFTNSEVKTIKIQTTNADVLSITAYPNPVVNQVNISIPTAFQNKNVVYKVFNVSGALVKQLNVTNSSKITTLPFNNLPAGVYVVNVQAEGKTLTQRIIKQ